jgi:hypothetical protein
VGVGICGFEGVRVESGGKWDFEEGELGDGVKVRVSSTLFGFLVGFFYVVGEGMKKRRGRVLYGYGSLIFLFF